MDQGRLARISEIIFKAADLQDDRLASYLDERCAGDAALRADVEAMLRERHRDPHTIKTSGADPLSDDDIPTITAEQAERDDKRIGPYRLIEAIGEGGMGVVYRAEQTRPIKRRVALKLVKLGMDTREVLARFDSERQALALMDHPNIAKVLDAGATEQGRPFFVMEYVQGEPITDYCDRNSLGLRDRLELFSHVCQAVQHAHQKGIIHRDLKPSNILVATADDQPIPKVIDFGIAKATGAALTEQTLFTEQGQLIGTPEYMSPEQASMGGLDIDTRSDIYGLGIILYELLSGMLPFESKDLRKVGLAGIQRVIQEEKPPRLSTIITRLGDRAAQVAEARRTDPQKLQRRLKGDLDSIVQKALEKDRTRRYQSAAAFGGDLARYLVNQPILARPPSTVYQLRKVVQRNKLAFGFAVSVVVLLVGFGAWMSVLYARAVHAERLAAKEGETAKQVSEFMTGLFEVSDPGVARGNAITAREILDDGAARIAMELADQPEVQAEMMGTMGGTYMNLGLYDEARPLLEEALEMKEALYGENDPNVVLNLKLLGNLFYQTGEPMAAMPLFGRALAILEEELGPDDPQVAEALHGLGALHWSLGEPAKAEALLSRGMQITESSSDPDELRIAEYSDAMGVFFGSQGRLEEAEPLFERALEIRRRLLDPDAPLLALSLNNMGMFLKVQERYEEAEEVFLQSLAIREKILDEMHPDIAVTLNNIGLALTGQGRYADAEAVQRRALMIQEESLGPDHPSIALSLNNLAFIMTKVERYSDAEPLYRQSLAIYEKSLPPDHPEVVAVRQDLAILLEKQGRAEEAAPYRDTNRKLKNRAESEER